MIKQYLKRRKLLQEQFERLMRELENNDFYPGEERKDFVGKALDIDRRLSVFHPVLVLVGICVVINSVICLGIKLKELFRSFT